MVVDRFLPFFVYKYAVCMCKVGGATKIFADRQGCWIFRRYCGHICTWGVIWWQYAAHVPKEQQFQHWLSELQQSLFFGNLSFQYEYFGTLSVIPFTHCPPSQVQPAGMV